ncbi:MAG: PGF-pre-PGF domain-containing protein, partial [Nanoarchaeota archaeon]
ADDTTPPIVTITAPAENQQFPPGTTSVTMSATTNEAATCKYGDADVSYDSMLYPINGQGTTSHTIVIQNLQNGTNYVRYVRCKDTAGNTMNNSKSVRFSVEKPTSFCGDNVCNATETRDSCSVDCPLSCDLTSASWDKKDAVEGEIVYLDVRGNSCDLKTISFEVKERDVFGDDAVRVNPSNVIFDGNSIRGIWTAEWQGEETGESDPPEYYFIASVVGTNEEISSGTENSKLLSVNKVSSDDNGDGYSGGGGGGGRRGGGGGDRGGGERKTIRILKDFNPETGVRQIELEVIDQTQVDEAQSIDITVSKYDSLPAAVSVAKTGQVYKYLLVETENLGSDLQNAKITFQVEKSWQIGNSLDKEDIALFKFDESLGRWDELQTTFAAEDVAYYYYDAELNSFSYFAIGKKEKATGEIVEGIPVKEKTSNVLVILIVLVVVLLISVILIRFIKKRLQKYEDNQP